MTMDCQHTQKNKKKRLVESLAFTILDLDL